MSATTAANHRRNASATVGDGAAVCWLVQFPRLETLRRYQEAVTLDRVMSEHHAAQSAVPLEAER